MAGPVVQIIDREDYKKHYLVSLPDSPLSPLPPSSVRVRTEFFTLSVNNFTYARLGKLLNWWGFHLLPENTPEPYNDAAKYGRLSCWGIGIVTASTSELAPVGTKMYGYLPLGTLEVDKQIADAGVKGQIMETTEYRKDLLNGFYNRYFIEPPAATEEDFKWDVTMQVLFETSYLINQYVFTWNPDVHTPIFPTGKGLGEWSAADADLRDAVVLVFAGSSKTGAAFAQQVRVQRPKAHQPRRMICIGSEASVAFSKGLGWYDDVLFYSDDAVATLKEKASLDAKTKVVVVDFGGRAGASVKWAGKLKSASASVRVITVGSSPDAGMARSFADGGEDLKDSPPIIGSALGLREGAIEAESGQGYYNGMMDAWKAFKANGGLLGVEFEVKDGLDAFKKDWDDLAAEKISPMTALLYRI